jgi:hypothetical protein
MAWDRFLQAAARNTRVVRIRYSATPELGREVRTLVSASSKGGEWRTKQAENAVSQSHLAWPLRRAAFSGNPGGAALAAYLRGVAEFEQGVLYGCGPAQVGFGGWFHAPFIASPFLLEVDLVPSHCGSRAPEGRQKSSGPQGFCRPYLPDICPTAPSHTKKPGRTYVSEG